MPQAIEFTPDNGIDFKPDNAGVNFTPDSNPSLPPLSDLTAYGARDTLEQAKSKQYADGTDFLQSLTSVPSDIGTAYDSAAKGAGKVISTVGNIPTDVYNAGAALTHAYPPAELPFQEGKSALPEVIRSIPREFVKSLISPENEPPAPPARQALSTGLQNTADKLATGFTTPEGIATLPLFESAAGRSLMLGVQALQTPSMLKKTLDTLQDPDSSKADKWEAVGDAGANLAMSAALALHIKPSEVKAKLNPEQASSVVDTTKTSAGIPDNLTGEPNAINPQTDQSSVQAEHSGTDTSGASTSPSSSNQLLNPTEPQPQGGAAPDAEIAPLNPGGSEAVLSPELQAKSKANNSRAAWGDFAKAVEAQEPDDSGIYPPDASTDFLPPEPPIVDQPVNNPESTAPSVQDVQLGGNPTSIKNETVDAERVARGLQPATPVLERDFPTVLDDATQRDALPASDPKSTDSLIAELDAKPRALTDTEDAMLLRRQVTLQNEFDKVNNDLVSSANKGEANPEAQIRRAALSDSLQQIYDVGKRSGTETGRGLNARKMLLNEDYSLAKMEVNKRAAVGGRQLTDAEQAEIQKQHGEIKATQDKIDAHDADAAGRRVDNAIKDAKATPQGFGEDVMRIARGIVDKWEKSANEARENIKARGTRFSAGVDPTAIADVAKIARYYIGSAGLDLARLTTRLIDEFGEGIAPHVKSIYDAAKKLISDEEKGQPEKVKNARQKIAKADFDGQIKSASEKVSEKVKAGNKTDIGNNVSKIVRNLIAKGIDKRESLVDAVHAILKESIPDITRRETMDAISGYGDYRLLSKDEISVKQRAIKGELQQVSKLEDLQAKKPLQKTGVERRAPTDEERKLIQQVNDAKRKYGVTVTDPETQLKSALDATKTRLSNEIKDLETQIADRQKFVKDRTPLKLDAEAEALKAKRTELKKQFDDIFGKPEMSDEKRTELAQKALERSIKDAEAKIKSGDIQPEKQQVNRPSRPELEPLRQKLDALRKTIQDLRDATHDKAAESLERQKTALENSIAEKEAKIKAGDTSVKGTNMNRPADPTLEPLKQQRDALNKQLAEMRKKPEAEKATELAQRKLDALNKLIKEKEEKISSGDLSAKQTSQNRPLAPDLEQAKQKLEALNEKIEQLRKGPSKTPEERSLAALKTRLQNSTKALEEKIAKGDYSKTPRKTVPLDREAMQLKEQNERAKQMFRTGLERDRLKQRNLSEKGGDFIQKWRRGFILSGLPTLAKLTAAAAARMLITPLEEGVGGLLGKVPVISDIASKAPREGGASLKAEVSAWREAMTEGAKDAWSTLRTGHSQLDTLFGRKLDVPQSYIDFFGHVHGALKAPVKRAEWARSVQKLGEFYAKNGVDITDPLVQTRIGLEAYKEAEKSIFMQRNFIADKVNTFIKGRADKTGHVPFGQKAFETIGKTLVPIIKVPTNLVAETLQYAFGLESGAARIASPAIKNALKGESAPLSKAIASLKPEEADLIMRELKKGSIGTAALVAGFLLPQFVGGYYQRGEKRPKGDVRAGSVASTPDYWNHFPLDNALQLGATVRRVADSKLNKRDAGNQGIPAGLLAGGLGLTEQIPFVRETIETAKAFDPHERGAFFGELGKSLLIPQIVKDAAEQQDKTPSGEVVKRKPNTAVQYLETGIPGLRKNVPVKK